MRPRIFVSRPAVLSKEQEARLEWWLRHLDLLEFDVVTLERGAYDTPPWGQIRSAIQGVNGLLILGFRQLYVADGLWRPGTTESREPADWWATPWNHVEAGLGLMAGVPVLVAHEAGVAEGVFSPDAWGGEIFGVRLEADVECAGGATASSGDSTDAVVGAWAGRVRSHVAIQTKSSS